MPGKQVVCVFVVEDNSAVLNMDGGFFLRSLLGLIAGVDKASCIATELAAALGATLGLANLHVVFGVSMEISGLNGALVITVNTAPFGVRCLVGIGVFQVLDFGALIVINAVLGSPAAVAVILLPLVVSPDGFATVLVDMAANTASHSAWLAIPEVVEPLAAGVVEVSLKELVSHAGVAGEGTGRHRQHNCQQSQGALHI